MDTHRFNAVDLLDGLHQVALLSRPQAIAFQRPAGPHRQRIDQLLAGFRCSQRPVGGDHHARAIKIVFVDGKGAGATIDLVPDRGFVERGDDASPLAIVERRIEHPLRSRSKRRPGERQQARPGDAGKPGQRLFHRRLGGERADAREDRSAGRVAQRREQRAGG